MRRPQGAPNWYTLVIIFGCSAVLSGGALAVALHQNAESDRKWCSVVGTIDQAWRETPPTGAAGKNLADDIHRLRAELNCPAGSVSVK